MKARALATVVVMALMAGTAHAQPPNLSMGAAKHYVGAALKKRSVLDYKRGQFKEVGACKRLSSTRVRCRKVYWFVPKWDSYSGWVTIWFSEEGDRVFWNYAFKIKRLDAKCWLVNENPKSSCTKVYRVR
jgi:hypothetical protein